MPHVLHAKHLPAFFFNRLSLNFLSLILFSSAGSGCPIWHPGSYTRACSTIVGGRTMTRTAVGIHPAAYSCFYGCCSSDSFTQLLTTNSILNSITVLSLLSLSLSLLKEILLASVLFTLQEAYEHQSSCLILHFLFFY